MSDSGLTISYGLVDGYIIKQMDRFAKMKQTIKATLDSHTAYRFWVLVDRTQDETYENRVKGTQITTVDSKLNEGKIGHLSSDWFTLHTSYFSSDLGLTGGMTSFLLDRGIRVNEDFAEVYYEATGSRLAARYVYADSSKSLNVLYSGTKLSGRTLPTTLGDTRLKVSGDTVTDLVVTDSTWGTTSGYSGYSGTVANGTILFENTINGAITSGESSFTFTNSPAIAGAFAASRYCLIEDADDTNKKEIIRLNAASGFSGVSGYLASGTTFKRSFVTGSKIWPMFNSVASAAGNGYIVPVDDRTVDWGQQDEY
jgi:hypothetical protein